MVTFHVEGEDSLNGSCCFPATCSVAIYNRLLRDRGKINDALPLVNLYFVTATPRRSVQPTMLVLFILSLRSVARIETSLNSCDKILAQQQIFSHSCFTMSHRPLHKYPDIFFETFRSFRDSGAHHQEPATASAFSQTDLFLVLIYLEIRSQQEP